MSGASSGATIKTKAQDIVTKIEQLTTSLSKTDGDLAEVIVQKQQYLDQAKEATATAEKQLELSRQDNGNTIHTLTANLDTAKKQAEAANTELETAKQNGRVNEATAREQSKRAEAAEGALTTINEKLNALEGVSLFPKTKAKLGKQGGKSVKGGKKMKKAKKSRARRKGKK